MVWATVAQGRVEEQSGDSMKTVTPTAMGEQQQEGEGEVSSRITGPPSIPPTSGPPSEALELFPLPPLAVLQDATQALAFFRAHYYPPERRAALEEDTRLLKEKYREAKALGERVQKARNSVTCLRKVAGQLRRWKDEKEEGEDGGRAHSALVAEEEAKVLQELEQEKRVYQTSYQTLRDLKGDIEGVQRAVEGHRARLQTTFEPWFAKARKAAGGAVTAGTGKEDAYGEAIVTCTGEEKDGDEEYERDEGQTQLLSAQPPLKSSLTQPFKDPPQPVTSPPTHLLIAPDVVEDDIAAFYRAKEELLLLRQQQRGHAERSCFS